MTRTPSRVLLIDDHEMSRRGLEAMLSTAEFVQVVGEADGCAPGLLEIERLRPDIVLLDIRMPDMDGLTCLDAIKRLDYPVAVIIVTLYNDRRYILEAIRRGAAGYVLKEASTSEILGTILAVVDGQLAVEPGLLREALLAPPDEPAAATYSLTPRELDVIRLVAQGLTNKEIGAHLTIAEDTVKKHVQNLIWKLRAADRTQAAIVAYRAGLLDPLPE